jgi:hypothetical protein
MDSTFWNHSSLGAFLWVVEPACKQHEPRHHQGPDRCAVQLEAIGNTVGPPHLEQPRGNLNALEATAYIAIQNFLAKDGPNHLSTGLNAGGVGQPSLIV